MSFPKKEKKSGQRDKWNIFCRLGIILIWLFVWQLLAMGVHSDILLVTPFKAFGALLERMAQPVFWRTVGMSLLRIGGGFLAGAFGAVLLAVLSFRFPFIRELISPLISLLKAIPVVSFVVLLLIWWGSSFLSAAICFLVVLPNVYVNALAGLKNTSHALLEMAQVFRLPFWNRFFYIYRPALRPFLYSGLNISLGMCWKSGVAAEVIGTPDFSIGEQLYMSKICLDTAGVFAWTAVIIFLSFGFEKIILFFVGKFFEWEPACKAGGFIRQGNPKQAENESMGQGKAERPARRVTAVAACGQRSAGNKIICRGLCKAYENRQVLRSFNADYEPGHTYYLTWESGSGKTTLLRILCGLETPDSGKLQAEASFGMVFQEDRLCEEYSALRNVELVLGDRERAQAALSELLEPEDIERPCSQLSGGMKRRAALVRAMESDAACLLLDEPFTGMDVNTRQRAEEYIRKKAGDRVLIIATHI